MLITDGSRLQGCGNSTTNGTSPEPSLVIRRRKPRSWRDQQPCPITGERDFPRLRYSASGSQWWRYSLSAKTSLRLSRPGRTEDRGRVTKNRRDRPGYLYSAHPTSLKCTLARFPRGVGYSSQERHTTRVSELVGRSNRCYPNIPVEFQDESS